METPMPNRDPNQIAGTKKAFLRCVIAILVLAAASGSLHAQTPATPPRKGAPTRRNTSLGPAGAFPEGVTGSFVVGAPLRGGGAGVCAFKPPPGAARPRIASAP